MAMAASPEVQGMAALDINSPADLSAIENKSKTPIKRKVVVAVRSTLADLVNGGMAAWAPTESQLNNMFRQRKFTNLSGKSEACGDLRSVVLHSVEATSVRSTFPISLGAQITGVDEKYYSSIGQAYSMIVLPSSHNTTPVRLQEDDVSVAYDFSARYPGFTADNLETEGIHAVPQRRFVLVALNHPLITAIQENQDKLQMQDIQALPDQMIKISTGLYETLMPLVKDQVRSQIKVADFAKMAVNIQPADHASWSAASESLTREAVAPIKADHMRSLARVKGDAEKTAEVNTYYAEKIDSEMGLVSHTPHELFIELSIEYNFLKQDPAEIE